MRVRTRSIQLLLIFAWLLAACSSTPEERIAKHLKRGDEYMQRQEYKEAVIEYKNAVKAGPNDGKLRWKLAQAALEAKDIRTAFQELKNVVEIEPSNYDALGRLGEIYVAAG